MKIKKVAIACQGGGSHTAFTAGALIEILHNHEELTNKGYEIIGFSGTSGGGICATLAWYGLNFYDADKGIDLLETFWERNKTKHHVPFCIPTLITSSACYNTTAFNRYILNTIRIWNTSSITFEYIPDWAKREAKIFMKNLLEGLISFNKIEDEFDEDKMLSLYIGAVNIGKGEFKVFKNKEITTQELLASAAVPPIFKPVKIGDYYYWDGLYSQNPPIQNFFDLISTEERTQLSNSQKKELMKKNKNHKPDEIWIIRINPKKRDINKFQTVSQEKDRQNELAGNLSLEQELNSLQRINKLIDLFPDSIGTVYKLVDCEQEITINEPLLKQEWDIELDYPSKFDRSPSFINALIEHGKNSAKKFLKPKL